MVGTTTIAAKPTVGSVQQSSLFHLKVLSLPRLSMDASMPVMQSEISAAYGRPAAHIGKIKNSDHQLCSVEPSSFRSVPSNKDRECLYQRHHWRTTKFTCRLGQHNPDIERKDDKPDDADYPNITAFRERNHEDGY